MSKKIEAGKAQPGNAVKKQPPAENARSADAEVPTSKENIAQDESVVNKESQKKFSAEKSNENLGYHTGDLGKAEYRYIRKKAVACLKLHRMGKTFYLF